MRQPGRPAHNFGFVPIPLDNVIVVHPVCDQAILVLDMWGAKVNGNKIRVRVEGICHRCDCYVRLEFTPLQLITKRKNGEPQ